MHVTIPVRRGTRSRRGLVIHRSATPPVAVGSPPRTGVAPTVVDLCTRALRLSDVSSLVGRVAQRYPRELTVLRALVVDRRNLRRRAEVLALIDDAAGGTHSELERRYLVDVERAHGLPPGERQRAVDGTDQDVHHREYHTTVELDGRAVHAPIDAAWRDMERDNAAAARGETTLRYGWFDVRTRPCEVAAQVAAVLQAHGWSGQPTPCGPECAVLAAAP